MKTCGQCGETKPFTEFYREKKMPDGFRKKCKKCRDSALYRRRRKNPDGYNEYMRRWRMKNSDRLYAAEIRKRYGISLDQYSGLLLAQNKRCAICAAPHNSIKKRGRLHVDHCHISGRIRGLLCANCNKMLGNARDRADLLRKGADYLDLPDAGP